MLFRAPAKVNYLLQVLRKRPDGYHDLRMVMQRIDLCDEIEIRLKKTPGIDVDCNSEAVSGGRDNIAWRAAEAILSHAGVATGVEISISKKIPVAAGLGGGSSDAATVLMGLNELLGAGFSDDRLMEIGVKLGADVPFFIFKKTALAEGIGEKLSPVEGLPPAWLVLVNPNIHVSTAWVYQNLRLTNGQDDYKLPRFCNKVEDICSILMNDLETVTIERFPVIRDIKETLLGFGAAGVLMSGSGPTVFAVFGAEEEARRCYGKVAEVSGWASFLTRTL
ncbi:MAG TPA: 4-(cytidine 5'-diphospho)-2-C-methyl-D-erythritol kinase [Geobacteraceae bacterium]|nr:4-(cytidine 5'-diphospho)-2-C-methyl-D-erythritol kinase [Geobacteraceae bacterium]